MIVLFLRLTAPVLTVAMIIIMRCIMVTMITMITIIGTAKVKYTDNL